MLGVVLEQITKYLGIIIHLKQWNYPNTSVVLKESNFQALLKSHLLSSDNRECSVSIKSCQRLGIMQANHNSIYLVTQIMN